MTCWGLHWGAVVLKIMQIYIFGITRMVACSTEQLLFNKNYFWSWSSHSHLQYCFGTDFSSLAVYRRNFTHLFFTHRSQTLTLCIYLQICFVRNLFLTLLNICKVISLLCSFHLLMLVMCPCTGWATLYTTCSIQANKWRIIAYKALMNVRKDYVIVL